MKRSQQMVTAVIAVVLVVLMAVWLGMRSVEEPVARAPEPVPLRRVVPEAPIAAKPILAEQETAASEPVDPQTEIITSNEPPVPVADQLNGSDAAVKVALEQLSVALLQWLTPEEQVRKWVLTIDLMADGEIPKRHQPWSYSMAPFKVHPLGAKTPDGKVLYGADSANEARLSPLMAAIEVIPPRTLGRFYRAWLPILNQAYGELGKSGNFAARVRMAVDRVIAVPPKPQDAELIRPKLFYQFADPALEKATGVERAVWRAGEENREKLQAYLRELKFYL